MGRFSDPFKRVGAVDVPPGLLDLGKRLLGQLETRQRFGAPPTLVLRKANAEGVAEARMIYGRPQVTYTVFRGLEDPARQQSELFVVTAANGADSTTNDATFPQQILDPGRNRTSFYSEAIAGFDAFVGRKGQYELTFPDGLRYAGNVDWVSAAGVRISWYGPLRRYWYDTFRRPQFQYGQWVFLNGAILLDIAAYNAAATEPFTETMVLGAALVGTNLYVMQATVPDMTETYDYAGAAPNHYAWASYLCPIDPVQMRLVRYQVQRNPLVAPPARGFAIVPNSGTSLWTKSAVGYVNPWVFSPDARVAETFAMPAELRLMFRQTQLFPPLWATITTPSPSSEQLRLDLDDGEVAEQITTLSTIAGGLSSTALEVPAEAGGPVAVDYLPDGTRLELSFWHCLDPAGAAAPDTYDGGFYDELRINGELALRMTVDELHLLDIRARTFVVAGRIGDDPAGVVTPNVFVNGQRFRGPEPVLQYANRLGFGFSAFSSVFPGLNNLLTTAYGAGYLAYAGVPLGAVSPMFLMHGLTSGTRGQGANRVGHHWHAPGAQLFEHVPGEELRISATAFAPTFLSGQFAVGAKANRYLTAADALGKRVPKSLAVDRFGNAMASFPMFVGYNNQPDGNSNIRVSYMVSLTTGRSLGSWTGVEANPAPIAAAVTSYDARYSTIWLLGKWPTID
jgi:hypothetical protein